MFKAFTDNITSLVGGKPASELPENAEPTLSPPEPNEPIATEPVKSQEAKVPPPRPEPPTGITQQGEATAGEPSGPLKEDGEPEGAEERDRIDAKLEEVTEKAKEWGGYLYGITKSSYASITAKAKELKDVVKESTIVGDFMKEQDKFVSANKERTRANEAAVAPWIGYNEEESMRTQMLALSNDKRNFVRNPPMGVQFHFDYETCYPVAMATLAEDPKLDHMRFQLVPKTVSEHDFWRNYFYRVSLIKQSTQLNSLAKQSAETGESKERSKSEKSKTSTESKTPTQSTDGESKPEEDDPTADDAPTAADEFISDAYNLEISDEDLLREMEALRAAPINDGDLESELENFELVGDSSIDEAALEKEIMEEMSKSTDLK